MGREKRDGGMQECRGFNSKGENETVNMMREMTFLMKQLMTQNSHHKVPMYYIVHVSQNKRKRRKIEWNIN